MLGKRVTLKSFSDLHAEGLLEDKKAFKNKKLCSILFVNYYKGNRDYDRYQKTKSGSEMK